LELRQYQKEAVNAIIDTLHTKKTALLTAPCAAGKTIIFCEIIKHFISKNKRCLVLMDREQLVSQNAKKISEFISDDNIGVACASVQARKEVGKQVVVASRQTLIKLIDGGIFDLVIIDEAHLFNQEGGQYLEILEKLKGNNPDIRLFGCTATPYRMTGNIYGDDKLFSKRDFQITTEELIHEKFLVPMIWKAPKNSKLYEELKKIKRNSTGELNEKQQFGILQNEIYIDQVYQNWMKHASNRKTAIYALNIQHAELISKVFREYGVQTWLIHSKMPIDTVRQNISDFKSGNGVIINVGILTIGSDIPSIECIMLARRTLSTSLFFQIVGRGARLSPEKKDCLVLDLCGSSYLHGVDPDKPIVQVVGDGEKKDAKLKLCPMCEFLVGMATKRCPGCGFEFPIEEKEESDVAETGDVELEDFRGIETFECNRINYFYHKNIHKPIPTVRAEYDIQGLKVKQWLCPEHSGFAQRKAGWYWTNLGGKFPRPRTVKEWLARAGELSRSVTLTVNFLTRFPEVKNVKICKKISECRNIHNTGSKRIEGSKRQMEMFSI
jgi:DNA repair protein RadD